MLPKWNGKVLHNVGALEIYHIDLQEKLFSIYMLLMVRFNLVETSAAGAMLDLANYMGAQDAANEHSGLTKVVSNMPWIYFDDVIRESNLTKNVWRSMLFPEQNWVELMKGVVELFWKLVDLVLGFCRDSF